MSPEFGFKINKSAQIDLDKADDSLYRIICDLEPSLKVCIFCGSCAGTCTAGQFTSFSFRRLSVELRRGMVEEVKEEISKCMLCGKCTLVCPRNVNTRHILYHLKKHFDGNEL
ncbi:MAG: 4Fe-4S dicluster domain-containing protein [Bacteroidales bacterium]|mgnify:CR=1 FL=1|jgi:heterodisulfide reductase subunit C|nr:4Fe-4S dicluster domain-containing protein [Bacteroidales bacterium]HPF00052.1 4Fe-4S dicluster domain-containing protein [Bacteroidales bacterium]